MILIEISDLTYGEVPPHTAQGKTSILTERLKQWQTEKTHGS